MEDRYSLNSYMFSSLLLNFYYFCPVTADNIFVLNMLLKVPDILSSLISFFFFFSFLAPFVKFLELLAFGL